MCHIQSIFYRILRLLLRLFLILMLGQKLNHPDQLTSKYSALRLAQQFAPHRTFALSKYFPLYLTRCLLMAYMVLHLNTFKCHCISYRK